MSDPDDKPSETPVSDLLASAKSPDVDDHSVTGRLDARDLDHSVTNRLDARDLDHSVTNRLAVREPVATADTVPSNALPAALPTAALHPAEPRHAAIPYRHVARVLAAIWIAAALLYLTATQLTLTVWQFRGAALAIVIADLWLTLRHHEFRTWLFATTFGQWSAIDRENVREPSQAGTYSRTVLLVLVMVAVSLTIQEYIGDRAYFERAFPVHGKISKYYELQSFAWWSGWRVFGYIGLPVLLLLFLRGEKIAAYHISLRNFFKHLWIYVVLFLCILPAVLYASTTPAFRHTYPFYRLANRSSFDLWTWEALYAAQFVSLEFFFRGFILQGLRRALGSNAVFVMIVPYCMIHYGKPLPETLGAIGAGLILGTLAMRTRSIWGGVLIHIGVAITMDVLALRGCPTLGSGHFCGE